MSNFLYLEEIAENTTSLGGTTLTNIETSTAQTATNTTNIDANHAAALTELQTIATNTASSGGGGSLGENLELRLGSSLTLSEWSPVFRKSHGENDAFLNFIAPGAQNQTSANSTTRTPGTGGQLGVTSTSANDTNAAGTGARTVVFDYINSSGVFSTTAAINLNGTTQVTSSESDICNVVAGRVTVVGSTGSNEGILRIDLSGGGSDWHGAFDVGSNTFESSHYHVPSGSTFYPTLVQVIAAESGQTVAYRVEARIKTSAGEPFYNYFTGFTGGGGTGAIDFRGSSLPPIAGDTVIDFRCMREVGSGDVHHHFILQGFLYTP